MSMSDRDVLEAMDRAVLDPPPMSLSPDAVVELGRSKVRRRRAVGAGMSIAAAAVAVTAWVGLSSGFDVVGDQIDPARTDPGDVLLVPELSELTLREVGDRLELSDSTGVIALVPKDMQGEQTILDGPDGLTYAVVTDWPQSGTTVALVEDARTGWTVPTFIGVAGGPPSPSIDPGAAPFPFLGAVVPPGPDGKPLDVLSLAAVTGDRPTCEMRLPGDAGTPTPIGDLLQIASVRLLADGRHWSACVVGDVFAGDIERPVAQWHGNAMVTVADWDTGFPDGLLTVVPEDMVDGLTPVWSETTGQVQLGGPRTVTLGEGEVALDWSIPLESLGGDWTNNLLGFDADGDGDVDVPALPVGSNRTLTGGRSVSDGAQVPGAPFGVAQVDDGILIATGEEGDGELRLSLSDSPQIVAGTLGDLDIVAAKGLELRSAEPDYYLLLQGPADVEVVTAEGYRTDWAGDTPVRTWWISGGASEGRELLPALLTNDVAGPQLVGGENRVVLRQDPIYMVTVHAADDLWVAQDGEELVAGRLSDPDLPFEVDANGIPTSLRDE